MPVDKGAGWCGDYFPQILPNGTYYVSNLTTQFINIPKSYSKTMGQKTVNR